MTTTTSDDQLFSIADIARHFSLPESTCRYYCKRFAEYIPSVGEGRRRRYRKTTLDVIAAILEEMKKSRTASAVEDALAIRFPRNALSLREDQLVEEPKPIALHADQFFPPIALNFMERQTKALEGIAKMLNMLTSHLCSNSMFNDTNAKNLEALQKEVSKLSILLDASEKNQQADIEQLRTWMGRFLRRSSQTA
ncbi:MAG: MerR family transcriptional regulator [Desulfovibrio sp.]|nr:MerR family transcriptional regulator [Desulfovibrio sp.]